MARYPRKIRLWTLMLAAFCAGSLLNFVLVPELFALDCNKAGTGGLPKSTVGQERDIQAEKEAVKRARSKYKKRRRPLPSCETELSWQFMEVLQRTARVVDANIREYGRTDYAFPSSSQAWFNFSHKHHCYSTSRRARVDLRTHHGGHHYPALHPMEITRLRTLLTQAYGGSLPNGTVMVSVIGASDSDGNWAFLEQEAQGLLLLRRFLCLLRQLNIVPILFTSTMAMARQIEATIGKKEAVVFYSAAFVRNVINFYTRRTDITAYVLKWPAVHAVMQAGFNSVLFSDIDVNWLHSPLEYLSGLRAHFAANLNNHGEPHDRMELDEYFERQEDIAGQEQDGRGVLPCCNTAGVPLNSGLVWISGRSGRDVLERAMDVQRYNNNREWRRNKTDFCRDYDQPALFVGAEVQCAQASVQCQVLDVSRFLDWTAVTTAPLRRAPPAGPPFAVHLDVSHKEQSMRDVELMLTAWNDPQGLKRLRKCWRYQSD